MKEKSSLYSSPFSKIVLVSSSMFTTDINFLEPQKSVNGLAIYFPIQNTIFQKIFEPMLQNFSSFIFLFYTIFETTIAFMTNNINPSPISKIIGASITLHFPLKNHIVSLNKPSSKRLDVLSLHITPTTFTVQRCCSSLQGVCFQNMNCFHPHISP